MQVVKKTGMILFVIWFAFVLFMPKRNLYYKVEQELAMQGIKVNEGRLNEGLFTLNIDDAIVYVKGIDLIHIKHASFFSLFFYSSVTLEEIVVDDSLKSILPTRLDEARLSHAIWKPGHMEVAGKGAFGDFSGDVDLIQRKVHLDFMEINGTGIWKRQLRKGEKGWYYETSF
ncbi:hypothetical protein YH65_00145 [Sulfurovum lithotrophicum]|uniref:LPS export ABC transporter periplasmic protein LptC n=1 Tax=Sulfurovum lithotrophicum TaxID=206403 RepID=A0A7U4RPR9_9BACT|nr:hypothetical protein [Sulfurovum lithotrophicum]AKF23996.1 hypothetical protein YH65_00145 [Sulfurovum lithotrophicum]